MTSCLTAVFGSVGDFTATIGRVGGDLKAAFRRVTCSDFSFGLVCSTSLGEECLWASDQIVLTVDGGRVYVTKD